MPLISVCIPTYNRSELLARLLASIAEDDELVGDVEVVIVDDGSVDGTPALVEAWQGQFGERLKYEWQSNAGRALALRRSIMMSSGDFIIPMDSDDYFLPGWLRVLKLGLDQLRESPIIDGRGVNSLIFRVAGAGTVPPRAGFTLRTNLLAFRADLGARGDMKEVADARLLKSCMYEVRQGCKRVPTSLLWARLAQLGDSIFINDEIVKKDYLLGGMTAQIRRLKAENPLPMMKLNAIIAESGVYRSRLYRIRAMVQWARYALHSGRVSVDCAWKLASLPLGFSLYAYDRMMRGRA